MMIIAESLFIVDRSFLSCVENIKQSPQMRLTAAGTER
jgi:hypothetical protein